MIIILTEIRPHGKNNSSPSSAMHTPNNFYQNFEDENKYSLRKDKFCKKAS